MAKASKESDDTATKFIIIIKVTKIGEDRWKIMIIEKLQKKNRKL